MKEEITKTNPVQLLRDKKAWLKLPGRIRKITEKDGIGRLTRLRELISKEAGLPMPHIRIVPWGWWHPGMDGVIYGMVRPIRWNNYLVWAVIIPASTPVIVDNDIMLRRLICHEFAHCFWYITKAIREQKKGVFELHEHLGESSLPDIIDRIVDIDKERLVEPADWFGEWDVKHFLPEGEQALNRPTNLFRDHWLKKRLPTRPPILEYSDEGTMAIEDEIVKHIRSLEDNT
jgi:hypothetical protein